MKLYIKLLLFAGIMYIVFIGIYSVLFRNTEYTFLDVVTSGLLFGITMSIGLGSTHYFAIREIRSDSSNSKSTVHQSREINLNVPIGKDHELCIESLKFIKKGKLLKNDNTNGIIEAKAGLTWKTFGDRIKFNLKKTDGHTTLIEVSSKPLLKITLVDYGKNLENVNKIEDYLINKST